MFDILFFKRYLKWNKNRCIILRYGLFRNFFSFCEVNKIRKSKFILVFLKLFYCLGNLIFFGSIQTVWIMEYKNGTCIIFSAFIRHFFQQLFCFLRCIAIWYSNLSFLRN